VAIFLQALLAHNTCTDGIQVDVVTDQTEGGFSSNEKGPISPLEEMTLFTAVTIESVGKRRLQPLHPDHQISAGRRHREVKVVAHQDESVKLPTPFWTSLKEAILERRFGAFG